MKGSIVGRRYARALFQLGVERGDAAEIAEELDQLTDEILGAPELERVLFTPIHPRAERADVMAAVCESLETSDEIRGFGLLLVDANRAALLPEVRDALRELVEQAAGRVEAEITSARTLESAEADQLRAALSERVGAQVTLKLEVDPELLGGAVARVGDLLIDGSVRNQLRTLRGALRKEGA